jgi:hypothetical protein
MLSEQHGGAHLSIQRWLEVLHGRGVVQVGLGKMQEFFSKITRVNPNMDKIININIYYTK